MVQSPWLYLRGNTIVDIKTFEVIPNPFPPQTPQQAWDAIQNGTVIDDYFQTNRIIINDCTLTPQTFTFARRHFQKVKQQNGFEIVEITP
jgi:hypothetical protein